ncbi:pantetheine-phosphate adenylyltransferase [Ectothiorhodospiraceae bacterium BW-2]|nr:pantetheine-phosphate adenylyltransferase [Ectothiorhodospiraceae bacterium BW-2]
MPSLTAIYPGSFDPVTNGHLDIIQRSAGLFDRVVVAVAASRGKAPLFTLDERLALLTQVTEPLNRVEVEPFNTLLVDFARQCGATVVIRGLRAVSDFDYEFQLAGMNRRLDPSLETLFMATAEEVGMISSSLVKEIAALGGVVDSFVPPIVTNALRQRLG